MNRSVRSLTIICPWATLLEVWIKTHIKRNSKIKNLFEINSLIGTIWQNRYAIRRKTFTPCKWRVMFNYIFNRLPSLQGHLYTLNLLLVHYMNAWPVYSCIHLQRVSPQLPPEHFTCVDVYRSWLLLWKSKASKQKKLPG